MAAPPSIWKLTDTNGDGVGNCYSYGYSNCDCNGYRGAEVNADAQAASHTGAEAVTMGKLKANR